MRSCLRPALRWLCLAVVLVVSSGCSFVPEEDQKLEADLHDLLQGRGAVALRDLTTFPWDTVYVFGGYSSGRHINETVGGHVIGDDVYTAENEDFLVFDLGGNPVRRAIVDGYFHHAVGREKWLSDVRIQPTTYCGLVLMASGDPSPGPECG